MNTKKKTIKKEDVIKWIMSIIMGVGCISFIAPFVYMLSNALKTKTEYYLDPFGLPPNALHWESFEVMIKNFHLFRYMGHSALIVLIAIILVIPVSVCVSYTFAKFKFRGSNLLYLLMIACMTIPPQVTVVPLYIALGRLGILNSFASIGLVNMGLMCGCTVMMTSFFRSIPNELLDAATIDGCGYFGTVWNVIVPVGKPAIAIQLILLITTVWNDLFYPQVLLQKNEVKTAMVAITELVGKYDQEPTYQLAALLICCIPTLVVYLFFQKYIIKGALEGAVKG